MIWTAVRKLRSHYHGARLRSLGQQPAWVRWLAVLKCSSIPRMIWTASSILGLLSPPCGADRSDRA